MQQFARSHIYQYQYQSQDILMLMWLKGRAYLFSSRVDTVVEMLSREERLVPHTNPCALF